MKKWLKEAKIQSDPETLFFLVGNQADLEDSRAVSIEKAKEFQKKMKLDDLFETSAKTGNNVEAAFVSAAKKLYSMNSTEDLNGLPLKGSVASSNTNGSINENKQKLKLEKHDKKSDMDKHRKKKSKCC